MRTIPQFRHELINSAIRKFGPNPRYLEIGVCDPSLCFDLIQTLEKDSVDPGVEFEANPVKYQMTSDEFFSKLEANELDKPVDYKWDVIFIDGLHLAEQVEKDIHNSLKHLNPNGFVFLHDCSPPDSYMARETYFEKGYQEPWNGTVWKAFFKTRATQKYIDSCVVDTDWGVGVLRFGNNVSGLTLKDNEFYEYNVMAKNRTRHLGLINPVVWHKWLSNEFHI